MVVVVAIEVDVEDSLFTFVGSSSPQAAANTNKVPRTMIRVVVLAEVTVLQKLDALTFMRPPKAIWY